MDFTENLLHWYKKNKRDLPWRKTKDPYAIWVSEIMLQQTRVDTAIDYYIRFMEHFPDVHALANADEQDLLNIWKGLGYYSRARNMHRTAKVFCENFGGGFPQNISELTSLPGIGAYTAGAILSIAYNMPVPAVDGNVLRVISRVQGISEDISKDSTKKDVADRVAALIPKKNAGEFTQALMELGAIICLPQSPDCAICPVACFCTACQTCSTEMFPVKVKKSKPNPVEEYWVLLVTNGDKLLMQFREDETLLKNLWGFPMIEKEECKEIQKLLIKRFGTNKYEKLGLIKHVFTHKIWHMHVICMENINSQTMGYEWVALTSVNELPIPTAFVKVFMLYKKNQRQ
jgi:A/G-specific adenine glycosylase